MVDVDVLYREVESLYGELTVVYREVVSSNWGLLPLSVKAGVKLGLAPKFGLWVGFVNSLRSASVDGQVNHYYWYDFKKQHPDRYDVTTGGADEAIVNVDSIVRLFREDVVLREVFLNSYSAGVGGSFEKHVLLLMLCGVKPERAGLSLFMDCVAGMVEPVMVGEWSQVSSSHRKAMLL